MRLPFSRVSFCMWGENRWWISLLLTALLGTMSFVAMVAWQRFARNASVKDDLGRMQGRWEATVDGTKVVMTIEGNEMSLMPVVDIGLFDRLADEPLGGQRRHRAGAGYDPTGPGSLSKSDRLHWTEREEPAWHLRVERAYIQRMSMDRARGGPAAGVLCRFGKRLLDIRFQAIRSLGANSDTGDVATRLDRRSCPCHRRPYGARSEA